MLGVAAGLVAQYGFKGVFGDKRNDSLAALFLDRMVDSLTVCLRRLARTRSLEVAFGRLLGNPKFEVEGIISAATAKTAEAAADCQHVLILQDTTDLYFESVNDDFREGLGLVGNDKCMGFNIHPGLAVDANTGSCLGLSSLLYWARTEPKKGSRNEKRLKRQTLPIEEKESFRWIENAEASKKAIGGNKLKTIVADRESDIYEEWARVPDENTEIITRSCYDRSLVSGIKLYAALAEQDLALKIEIELPAITGKRKARTAIVEIRFTEVEIKKSKNSKDTNAPSCVRLRAVEAREIGYEGTKTSKPILWRILTTHEVRNASEALQIIEWYKVRWQIEQLFRTLKRQGLNIEGSHVESYEKLKKLAALAVVAAVRIMQLTMARNKKNNIPIQLVFEEDDIPLLKKLSRKLEGKTKIQKNNNKNTSLAWGSWIIARLGGWKSYSKSERPPGPITMKRGLEKFQTLKEGWLVALEL